MHANALFLFAVAAAGPGDLPPWAEAEKGILEDHVELTSPARFRKAGECYVSPDGTKIIFQAIERADDPSKEEAYYQMYVADLVYEGDRIVGSANVKRLSPAGSSNTCGWFHPTEPNKVLFASTLVPPKNPGKTGYQRESRQYVWQFPEEMDIFECDLDEADGTAATLQPVLRNPEAYLAECVIRDDARYMIFCERVVEDGKTGGDLIIMDLLDGRQVPIAGASGYDGGPFFSPDGWRVCYRSDRRGDDLLQIFVAELALDYAGNILGVDREFQLTDNVHVNWAPFWHPGGRHLVYTTSELGHENYEVFLIDADAGDDTRPTRYGTRKRRVTHADGFDGLPAFNADGSWMLWTSQRSADGSSQVFAARFLLDVDAVPGQTAPAEDKGDRPERVQVTDPESGLIYLYDPSTHRLTAYDPKSHAVRDVDDPAEVSRALELFRAAEDKGG